MNGKSAKSSSSRNQSDLLTYICSLGQIAKPLHQANHVGTILGIYGGDFQTHPMTGLCVPHDGLDPDPSFLNKEINLSR